MVEHYERLADGGRLDGLDSFFAPEIRISEPVWKMVMSKQVYELEFWRNRRSQLVIPSKERREKLTLCRVVSFFIDL